MKDLDMKQMIERKNRFIKYVYSHVLVALMIWLAACSQVNAADKMKLLLDWFVNPDHGPIVIAKEKGYFEEAGLDVDIVAPADPSNPPKFVAAGQADLAISYEPQLHIQTQEGLPLMRVGTLVATPLNCLLVLKDGPIQDLADLKGKKIGYSIPGFEEALISTLLQKGNVDKSDVELINVNWSLSPSLLSKKVDAVLGAFRNFELNQLDIEGVPGRCFYIEEEGVPPYDELIFIAHKDKMDRDKIKKFLVAIERATQYIINHPQESWEMFANTSKDLQNELNKRAWRDTLPRFALRPSALDKGRYQRFDEFLYQQGIVKEIRPVNHLAVDLFE